MPMFIPLVIAVGFELGTVAIIGGALTAIGGIVGSKELSIVGGLISLGSGLVGAGASGASGAGTVGGEAAASAAVPDGISSEVAGNIGDIVTPHAQTVAGTDASANLINEINTGGQAANLQGPQSSAIETIGGVPGQSAPLIGSPTGGTGIMGDASQYLSSTPGAGTSATDGSGIFAKDPALSRLTAGETAKPGMIQQGIDWIKQNPQAANMAGGFLKGAGEAYFKNKSNQELMEIYKQRNLIEADKQALQRELAARGIANANYVPPSIGMSLNQNASLYPAGQGPSQFRYQPLIGGA